MENVYDKLVEFAMTYGIKIIGAVLILIIGRIAAGITRGLVTRLLRKMKTDEAIVTFLRSFTYVVVITFAVIAALAKFGVQTASFIAILGAAGFAVGFALQGSLSSFAAGILTLVFKPFRVGDFIAAAGVAVAILAWNFPLLNLGYKVTGSDLSVTPVTERLTALGARVDLGHEAGHVGEPAQPAQARRAQ